MLSIANIKTLAIIVILLIILSTIIIMATLQTQPTPSPQPTLRSVQPTSYPELAPPSILPEASIDNNFIEYSQQYLEQQEKITQDEKTVNDQALKVSKFVDKLPYQGKFTTVTYNIYNNQVYLEYNRNNKDEALSEFVNLLKENQIENIGWLYNLEIVEK